MITTPVTGSVGPAGRILGGVRGVPDLAGSLGRPGPTGPTGQSAYQAAVAAGFVGTEAEWLASLTGGDKEYTHDQGLASSVWVITHNLGKYPTVFVVDSAGDEVEGAITHVSTAQLTVTFSAAFSGSAYLN